MGVGREEDTRPTSNWERDGDRGGTERDRAAFPAPHPCRGAGATPSNPGELFGRRGRGRGVTRREGWRLSITWVFGGLGSFLMQITLVNH